jgi:8-oxo-dGTP pyrophosphatase MutT (NUDIX family)
MTKEIQKFHVGIKAFVLNGQEELLLLRESSTGQWELPGGRIDVGEELQPQENVLRREFREELGPDVQVKVGPLALTWVRERKPGDFVFLVGRLCRFESGVPTLSEEHDAWAWVAERELAGLDLAHGYREALAEFWRLPPAARKC